MSLDVLAMLIYDHDIPPINLYNVGYLKMAKKRTSIDDATPEEWDKAAEKMRKSRRNKRKATAEEVKRLQEEVKRSH